MQKAGLVFYSVTNYQARRNMIEALGREALADDRFRTLQTILKRVKKAEAEDPKLESR
jgi:hypothetical protein